MSLFIPKACKATQQSAENIDISTARTFLKTWKVGSWPINMVLIPCINTVYSWICLHSCFLVIIRVRKVMKSDYQLCHICLSNCMEQLGYHQLEFHEKWYLRIFHKSVKNIHVSLKSDQNNRYFRWRHMYIYDNISVNSSQNEKRFRQKLYRKSKHTFYFQ
jgi:hypothetical protein